MITIPQGKPVTNRFKIFVPLSQKGKKGDKIICRHPRTEVSTRGEIYDTITIEWHRIPEWICYETYNLNASQTKKALEKAYPEHRNQDAVRILLIKQD